MRLVSLVILLLVVIGGAIASARVERERGPWLLTSLPSMGSITWRCTAGARRSARAYALGFRALVSSATDEVRLLVNGRVVLSRTLQPGESVAFPHLAAAVQRCPTTVDHARLASNRPHLGMIWRRWCAYFSVFLAC
jgi:hypothetical protein